MWWPDHPQNSRYVNFSVTTEDDLVTLSLFHGDFRILRVFFVLVLSFFFLFLIFLQCMFLLFSFRVSRLLDVFRQGVMFCVCLCFTLVFFSSRPGRLCRRFGDTAGIGFCLRFFCRIFSFFFFFGLLLFCFFLCEGSFRSSDESSPSKIYATDALWGALGATGSHYR